MVRERMEGPSPVERLVSSELERTEPHLPDFRLQAGRLRTFLSPRFFPFCRRELKAVENGSTRITRIRCRDGVATEQREEAQLHCVSPIERSTVSESVDVDSRD